MKTCALYLKKGLAWVLTIALLFSFVAPEYRLRAHAEEAQPITVTDGEAVANSYSELSEAEKALLSSGLLAGSSYSFEVPSNSDGLITVDPQTKTITADRFTTGDLAWMPGAVEIVVSGEAVEEVKLTDGRGVYGYEGDAFTVKVGYLLQTTISESTQQTLLSTPDWLKTGVEYLDAAADQAGNLYILEQGMPELVKLSNNGIQTSMGTVNFSDEVRQAIAVLHADMTANGGRFKISTLLDAYGTGAKSEYLLTQGKELKTTLDEFVPRLSGLNTALNTIASMVDSLIAWGLIDATTGKQVETLSGVVSNLYNSLLPLSQAEWTAADYGTALVKADITTEEYQLLDRKILALDTLTDIESIRNPVTLAGVELTCNMSMCQVTLQARLECVEHTVGSTALITRAETEPVVLTLPAGTTRQELEAAIANTGLEEAAHAEWAELFSTEHYRTVTSALPEELTGDLAYTITITPCTYDLTLSYIGGTITVPYGYQLYLEPHGGTELVYDYLVDGAYVPEGSVYVVTGNTTVDRETGEPYVENGLYQLVAQYYCSDVEGRILTSGALRGDEAINVRYPDKDDVEQLITIEEDVLTAANFPASYQGLEWVPFTYTVVTDQDKAEYSFEGKNSVTIREEGYDRVDVVYALALTNFSDATLNQIANLPYVLNEEAKVQATALDKMCGYLGEMKQLDKTKLGALSGVIEVTDLHSDPAKNQELKAYFKGVVGDIIVNCIDSNNLLKFYNMLAAYADTSNGGLSYYYQNSKAMLDEVTLLSGYLKAMLADSEKKAALTALVEAVGYGDYADKIELLEGAMAELQAALQEPNEAIMVSSPNLGELTAHLNTQGIESHQRVAGPMVLYSSTLSVSSDSTVVLSLDVVIDGKRYTTEPISWERKELMTADVIDRMLDQVEAIMGRQILREHLPFYSTDYDRAAIAAQLEGKTGIEAYRLMDELTATWTAIPYTVLVEGMEPQTITVNHPKVELAKSPTVDEIYRYIIGGQFVSAGVYTFTLEEMATHFTEQTITIPRNVSNVRRENLINLVNQLNASVTDDAVIFALLEQEEDYSIVMRINGADTATMQQSVTGAAMGLVNSGYSYVALDNCPVIYMDEFNTLNISIQAVVDAVLRSGVGTDTILQVMDAQGNIQQMELEGEVISLTPLPDMGGKLIATAMQLGNDASDATDVDFYITLGSASPELISLRSQLEGELGQYFSVVCRDGQAQMELTLPEQAYQYYLAMLLLTGELELSDVKAVNGRIAFEFLQDLLSPVLVEEVSVQSYLNTLEKVGLVADAQSRAEFEAFYDYLTDYYSSLEFTYDANSCVSVGTLPIKELLDSFAGSMGTLVQMVKEYETGLALTTRVTLTNLSSRYNALYLDTTQPSAQQFGMTNLSGTAHFSGGAVVVLLDDVSADLTFDGSALLNLNGYTLTGNVVCNGAVSIVDTSPVAEGGISGNISGTYTMSSGRYYSLRKFANGDVTLTLDAGFLTSAWTQADIEALAVDVAADLFFNSYANSKLFVNGKQVYSIAVEDLVGLLSEEDAGARIFEILCGVLNSPELAELINTVIRDVTDFDALEQAILSNQPVLSYSLTTANWSITTDHVLRGDYITVHLLPGGEEQGTLSVMVGGSAADQILLAELMSVLQETTVVNAAADMKQSANAGVLHYDWSFRGDAVADMTVDAEYAIVWGVVLAAGMDAQDRTALVNGLRSFYTTDSLARLEAAFNAVTVEELIHAMEQTEGTDFQTMVADLGLTEVVNLRRVKAEATARLIHQWAAALKQAGLAESGRTLGSFYDSARGGYDFSVSAVEKHWNTELRDGYSVAMDVKTQSISLMLLLFGEADLRYNIVVSKPGETPVYEGSHLVDAFASIDDDGYIVTINADKVTMTGTIMVAHQVTLRGAGRIDEAGCNFLLSAWDAAIYADDALTVYSAADGYIVVCEKPCQYTMKKVSAPRITDPIADCWTDTLITGGTTTHFLCLDLPPKTGLDMDDLLRHAKFTDLAKYDVNISIAGNDGSGIVKTGDKMMLEVLQDGMIVAYVTYTLVVMGDTNGDGIIQAGDAVVMHDIYNGNGGRYSHAILLAADSNRSGTVEFPAVESGDAVRIMNKYFDWESYLKELKKQH